MVEGGERKNTPPASLPGGRQSGGHTRSRERRKGATGWEMKARCLDPACCGPGLPRRSTGQKCEDNGVSPAGDTSLRWKSVKRDSLEEIVASWEGKHRLHPKNCPQNSSPLLSNLGMRLSHPSALTVVLPGKRFPKEPLARPLLPGGHASEAFSFAVIHSDFSQSLLTGTPGPSGQGQARFRHPSS